MKHFINYINESNIDNIIDINEGEIWNNIKYHIKKKINKLIDSFFGDSSDTEFKKRFNRYNDDNDNYNNNYKTYDDVSDDEFSNYINKFNVKKCLIRFSSKSELEKIFKYVIKPNEIDKTGFYKFDLNTIDFKNSKIISVYNSDSNAREILYIPVALIEISNNLYEKDILDIYNLQILTEYQEKLKLIDLFKLLITDKKFSNIEKIYVEEIKNKDLYNKVINDCNFEKNSTNKTNIAEKIIKTEKSETDK